MWLEAEKPPVNPLGFQQVNYQLTHGRWGKQRGLKDWEVDQVLFWLRVGNKKRRKVKPYF
jgi:hypothetical protein